MKFSKRTEWASQENELTKLLSEKRRRGIRILDLTQSNPTRCGFKYSTTGLLQGLSDAKSLSYEPDAHGLRVAREAICDYYAEKNIVLKPEQIFLTAGSSEAYSFLLRLLTDPRDAILAPKPSYPLFDYLSELNDVQLEKYPLSYAEGWNLGPAALENFLNRKPRAMILVNPNNPTGNFVSEKEGKIVNNFCLRAGPAVISDEVFLDFSLKENVFGKSFAGNESVLTFTLGGISKMLGLPQMKVSWIVVSGPENLRNEAIQKLEIIADTYLSVNTPSQLAMPAWLSKRREITGEIRERVSSNRHILAEKLKNKKDTQLLEAEGGWQAILQVESPLNDEELAIELLEKKDVLVHPGYFFDLFGGNFLVISLLLPSQEFQEAVDRLSFV